MISFDEFKKLELIIATIKEVEEHPNADKLYVLKIDIGGEVKQIVAGIRPYYAKESLVGRQVVVVNNLQPVTLRGVESQGMLLAASDQAGGRVVLLAPEADVPAGSTIR